jgi:tetraacyldisaccharide 4'-kinase
VRWHPPRRPRWLDAPPPGLGTRLALAPLVPLAWAWGLGAWLDRHARGARVRAPVRLRCRVVSVGSLVVGGSGKTPAAAWIAARLGARGHRVALASRGTGRRIQGRPDDVLVASDGHQRRAGAAEVGDEPVLLAAHAPGVPVLVGRDRARVGRRAMSLFGVEVLVLDDGFQHHRLARDVDVLVFDQAGLGNGALLPRGPLRERVSEAARADAVLVVDGPMPEADAERLARHASRAAWFAARRRPIALRRLDGGAAEEPRRLAGRRVGLLAGVGRPASLRHTLEGLGATVCAERILPDHHGYRASDLRGLAARAPLWVTTEKDAVKILPSWCEGLDLRVLVIELEPDDPERLLAWIEARLASAADRGGVSRGGA